MLENLILLGVFRFSSIDRIDDTLVAGLDEEMSIGVTLMNSEEKA